MSTHILYARKSTESSDRQAASIPNQIQDLRAVASRLGIAISEVLTEERSAKAPGRPVFTALLRRIERGEVTGILCWKPDRLARNYYDAGCLQQALSDGKLKEIVTPEKTFTRDGVDQLMAALEFSLGAKYSTDLAQRVWWGNEKKFLRGGINHRPMLGYLLDPVTKETIDDPERWPLIARMLDLVHTGALAPLEVWQVATTEWGLTNRHGQPLSRSNFYRMLRSPFYAGIKQLQDGRRYKGAHHPMVTEGQFLRIQEILDRAARPKKKRHAFAFSALFTCAT
jgi:DNA invertase Pin-like site-specific DNA recombinase